MMLASFIFSACSSSSDDNDDNKNYSDIGIVGVWKVVDYTSSAMVSILSDLTLYADGTFKTQTSRGTWKLNGNELTLKDNNNEVIFTIENFTGNEMTLRATIKGSTLVLYLKRVGDADVEQGNDDSEASPSSFLVGTWKTTFVEGWGQEVNVNDPDYLQLQDNGNYVHVEWENNAPYISYGRWSYSNDKLTLKETEGDLKGSTFVYDIVKVETDKITVTLMGATATLIRVSDSVIEKYLNN